MRKNLKSSARGGSASGGKIQSPKVTTILGVKIHNLTLPQALKRAEDFLRGARQHYIVTPNPEIVLHARRNPKYRTILNKASLSIPDGTGLLWASKKICGSNALKERVTGVDFMLGFIRHLAKKHVPWDFSAQRRILLLGGKNGAARKTADLFKKKFPQISFYAIRNHENKHLRFVVNEVIEPEVIFLALGAPKQELWIRKNLSKFPTVKLAMGVGGAFDMISGKTPRAPSVVRELRMEWLWRLMLEPHRFPRIFQATVIFPLTVLATTSPALRAGEVVKYRSSFDI